MSARSASIAKHGALLVVFGILYCYNIAVAIGNIIGVRAQAAGLNTQISPLGWFILCGMLALNVALLLCAAWLCRRRPFWVQLLVLFAGLAIASVATIEIMYFNQLGMFFV